MLATEVVLNMETGIKMIECNEIIESGHWGCLTDIDVEKYFNEGISDDDEIERRTSNSRTKSCWERFAEKCEEYSNGIYLEHELNESEFVMTRGRVELIENRITYVWTNASTRGKQCEKMLHSEENARVSSIMVHCKLIVKKPRGKCDFIAIE